MVVKVYRKVLSIFLCLPFSLSLSLAQQQSLIHNLHERLFPTLLFYYFQSEAKLVQAGFLTASNLFKAIF